MLIFSYCILLTPRSFEASWIRPCYQSWKTRYFLQKQPLQTMPHYRGYLKPFSRSRDPGTNLSTFRVYIKVCKVCFLTKVLWATHPAAILEFKRANKILNSFHGVRLVPDIAIDQWKGKALPEGNGAIDIKWNVALPSPPPKKKNIYRIAPYCKYNG